MSGASLASSRRLLAPHTLGRIFLRSIVSAYRHDCIHLAQSGAYSSMIALFPALIVAAAIISVLPESTPLRLQLSVFFDRILPSDVSPILQSYFDTSPYSQHSVRAQVLGVIVSLSGASGVIATLMEGIRRAYKLPEDCWTFWQRRRRALLLVPLALVPLGLASLIVVFGHLMTLWLGSHVLESARPVVVVVGFIVRWGLALSSSVGLIALLYHLGTPARREWGTAWPGALVATAMWFLTTLAFGWYVTRFANYSQVYGSLGAGIALLFWLYLICLSVLSGAEFNMQYHEHVCGIQRSTERKNTSLADTTT